MAQPQEYLSSIGMVVDYQAAIDAVIAGDSFDGAPAAATRFEPGRYIRERLGYDLWHGDKTSQIDIVDHYALVLKQLHERRDYERGLKSEGELIHWQPGQTIQNWISVDAGHNVGKCVAASEWLTLASGQRVQAKDLVGHKFRLPTLRNGEVVFVDAHAEWNAVETVYEIVTENGKRAVRNSQHPFWAADGQFETGKRPQIKSNGWRGLGEIKEGDLVAVANCFEIESPQGMNPDEIKVLAYLIGDGCLTVSSQVHFSQSNGKQLDEFKECIERLGARLAHSGGCDYRVYGQGERGSDGRLRNPIIELCVRHGLMGKGSHEKRIPSAIFGLPKDQLSVFLSRLYSTDGWACNRDVGAEIGYCSTSRGLIDDLIELLQRFAVHGRLYHKSKVDAWQFQIINGLDLTAFADRIGIFGKEDAVRKAALACKSRVDAHAKAISERPNRPRWNENLALSGTRWERVKSVEATGIEPTVAIEVPDGNTFLTSFYEHNTFCGAALVSHFFDSFKPGIIYCFAPAWDQINDLLFKEVRKQRAGKGLPGKVLDGEPRITHEPDHFVTGKATNNSNNTGTERTHGQHEEYLMFVIDEAEGVPTFVFDAVRSMSSGGICVVLVFRNPRTTTCEAHKIRRQANVKTFRISCLDHPNVRENREVIPGSVRCDYVTELLDKCEQVNEHSEDDYTFELPWKPGVIYRPSLEFLWRVLGIASSKGTDDTFCPPGRYEAALTRQPYSSDDPTFASLGIDCARYGNDNGTGYVRHAGRVWKDFEISKQDGFEYYLKAKATCLNLYARGVRRISIRIDAGGGYHSTCCDNLRRDADLREKFPNLQIIEVHNNGKPSDKDKYADLVTEMYAYAGEALKVLRLDSPSPKLERDLCERKYTYVIKTEKADLSNGMHPKTRLDVKELVSKDKFKDKFKESPDDGDGFVLAVAPDRIFPIPRFETHHVRI